MALTNAGRDFITTIVVGAGGTAFNNANGYLGVGDDATAFAGTQTDLVAAANKLRKAMNATYPTLAVPVVTAQASFLPAEANYVWNEWGWFNAAAAGTMMSRQVASLGTKPSTQTWVLTSTLTFNNP